MLVEIRMVVFVGGGVEEVVLDGWGEDGDDGGIGSGGWL